MGSKSLKGRVACMAEGGVVQNETPEQLMARMAAKYKMAPPAQQPAPQQQQPAAQAPEQKTPQGIVGLLTNRRKMLESAANYAQGGIVARAFQFKGKGGPTDDEIPVKVAGQNINVSNGEKAVVLPAKTAQNPQAVTAIEDIIEQTNGKPTSRDGSNFANGGFTILDDLKSDATKKAENARLGEDAANKIDQATYAAQSAAPSVPAQPAASPIAAKPIQQPDVTKAASAPESSPASTPVGLASRATMPSGSQFDGKDISGQKLFTNASENAPLANVPASSPIPTVPGQSLSQRAGNPNLGSAADNLRQLENIQSANASMTPQGGAAFLADPNEAANAEKTQRWREDELIAKAGRNPAAGQLATAIAHGNSHIAAEGIRSQATREGIAANAANAMAAQGLTRRGQDIAAQRDSERNRIDEMRLAGNPLDNQARQLEINQKTRINTLQEQAVNGKTDEEKQAARQSLAALGIGAKAQDEYDAKVVESWDKGMKNGEQVVTYNKRTGQQVSPGSQQPQQQIPKAGEIRGGYKFKGGNPADQSSWEKA